MKLTSVKDVHNFLDAVNACRHDVFLQSQEGDVFNLKSSLSQYVAVGRLLEEAGDSLELFARDREDEAILMRMISRLGQ